MILPKDYIAKINNYFKKMNKSIGFTSGTFDILHYGHTQMLSEAAKICDVLIVGVNTDDSVKRYKKPSGPINKEEDRLEVINSLRSVDYCFLFDDNNNNKNIDLIKPDFYFKGGDYKQENLTSASIVESYGGKTIILSKFGSVSTTSIIEKIKSSQTFLSDTHKYQGIVFIDRDGVINKDIGYLKDVEKVELIDNAAEAIRILNQTNLAVVVVSNQPGISYGLQTEEETRAVNRKIISLMLKENAYIDKFYICPDTRKDSWYKKPNPGMLVKALSEIKIKEEYTEKENRSSKHLFFMIGDRKSDLLAGINSDSIKPIGVETGVGLKDIWSDPENKTKNISIKKDLLEAVKYVIEYIEAKNGTL